MGRQSPTTPKHVFESRVPLVKRVDKSVLFLRQITVPRAFWLHWSSIPSSVGEVKDIELGWWSSGCLRYPTQARVRRASNPRQEFVQIQWKPGPFHQALYRTFAHTYMALYFLEHQQGTKNQRTHALLDQHETLEIFERDEGTLIVRPHLVRTSDYMDLFAHLTDLDIYNLSAGEGEKPAPFVATSTEWMPKSELQKFARRQHVIYYLADTKRRELYIGKANTLGARVKEARDEIPGWNMFRFDELRPTYHRFISRLEDLLIRSYARVLSNTRKDFRSLELSDWRLVNKQWKRVPS